MQSPKKHTQIIFSLLLIWLIPKTALCNTERSSSVSISPVTIYNTENDVLVECTVNGAETLTTYNAFLKPKQLIHSQVKFDQFVEDVAVKNSYIYIANGYDGIQVYNINDPTNPYFINQYTEYVSYIRSISIYNKYLFASNFNKGILLYEISKTRGELVYQNNLFDRVSPDIDLSDHVINIEVYNKTLFIHMLSGKLYSGQVEKCIDSNSVPHFTLLNPYQPIARFIINKHVFCCQLNDGEWYKKNLNDPKTNLNDSEWFASFLNESQFGADVQIYDKTPSATIIDDKSLFLYMIQYDKAGNRQIVLATQDVSGNIMGILRYPINDARKFMVQDNLIYAANGFNGIAILPTCIVIDGVMTYNNKINLSFPREQDLNDYQLTLFDQATTYNIHDITFLPENASSVNDDNQALIIEPYPCINGPCFKIDRGHIIIQILTPMNPVEPWITIKDLESAELKKCTLANPEKQEYACSYLKVNKCYRFSRKINERFTFIKDMWPVKLDTIPYKMDLTPPYEPFPQISQEITFYTNTNWEMISFPIILDKNSMKNLLMLDENNTNQLMTYTEKSYTYIYQNDTITPGYAYWFKCSGLSSPTTITITGQEITQYAITLEPGWHMIGCINQDSADLIIDISNKVGVIYYFENGRYHILDPPYSLKKNRGYWIKVLSTCTISMVKN
jgi:hypothetical protein